MSESIVRFIVSEGFDNSNNRQALVNPILAISTPFMPTSLSFVVSMVVYGPLGGQNLPFKFKIRNVKEDKVIFDSGVLNIEPPTNYDSFVITMDLKNIAFESDGKYENILQIDGDEHSDIFFVIKESK